MEVLHPIRLLAQPDADITTVFHSFFVFSYDPLKQSVDTLARHPLNRKNLEQAEDGLKQFLTNPDFFQNNEDICVSHVMTNHDGRLFLFARCYHHKIIAIVSVLPILSFFRSFMNYLETAPSDSILPTVYTFCEFPILPLPSLNYQFEFTPTLTGTINFGHLQNLEENDMDIIAMTVLTPTMIIKAWETLILERSILIVSKDTSLLLPVCDFIRKLITPMSYPGTFIPIMPSIELLDATGFFIMGADVNQVINSDAKLSGIVILDLDRQTIIHTPIITGQNLPEEPYCGAPLCLLQNIYRLILQKTHDPLNKWLTRSFNKSSNTKMNDIEYPISNSKRCTEILKIFSFINTAILSSQCCSTKGFFRTILRPDLDNIHYILGLDSIKEGVTRMGYSEYFGFIVGCMQLWKDTELVDDVIHHTIFCWIELDHSSLSVYEYADDLPLILIPIEEISAVTSCNIEPEGYVFEITLKNQLVFRFTSGDPHSRQLWLNAIEAKLANSNKNNISPAVQTLSQMRHNLDCYYSTYSISSISATSLSPLPSTSDKRTDNNNMNNSFNINETPSFSLRELGQPPLLRDIDINTAIHYHEFRNLVRRTQAVLSLYNETQSVKYEFLFSHRRENLSMLLNDKHYYETKMKKYISNIYRTNDMLLNMKKDYDNNRLGDNTSVATTSSNSTTSTPTAASSSNRSSHHHGSEKGVDGNGNSGISSRVVKQPSITGAHENNSITTSQDTTDTDSGKQGIFRRLGLFSSRKKSLGKSEPANDDSAKVLTPAEAEKEAHEKFILVTMHKIFLVALAYNRALSEINNTIVEDRFGTLKGLIEAAKTQVLELKFQVSDIISACQGVTAELTQRATRTGSLSSKSPLKARMSSNVISANAVEGCLFEVLFEVLIPPSVAFKNQFAASRTTSYSQAAFPPPGESETGLTPPQLHLSTRSGPIIMNGASDLLTEGYRDSGDLTNTASNHANNNGSKSPLLPTKIQFDAMKEDYLSSPSSYPHSNRESAVQSPVPDDPLAVIVGVEHLEGNNGVIDILSSDNEDDFPAFDVHEFLVASNDEYETLINAIHMETKKQLLQFLQNLEEKHSTDEGGWLYTPVITTLLGYVYHQHEDYRKAIKYYSKSNLINQAHVAQCILKAFTNKYCDKQKNNNSNNNKKKTEEAERERGEEEEKSKNLLEHFSEPHYILDHMSIKNSLGMHSYRLILELIYTELKASLEKRINENNANLTAAGGSNNGGNGGNSNDISLPLGNFRSYFRSGQQLGKKAKPTAASTLRAEFEWNEPSQRSEILNEVFTCTKLTSDLTACEISTQLLIRLREVLKTYASSPAGEKYTKKVGSNLMKIKISPQTLQDIQNLSSFKKFELESCQLQKIDMNNLNTNERLFIFTNVYNILIIHSIISRGSPGNTLLERTSFMRSARYNVAGHIFSLIDIEHGILRNASTKPMLLGPLSFDMSFSERDPRRKFALDVPKPNISFCLFQASASSPPLCVLTDVNHVDKEMSRYAKQYFLDSVKFDYNEKAIYLPALVKVYWADFGSKQNDVLRYIAQTAGSQFAAKTKEYLASIGGSSAKTHFATLDWTPVFILNDN